MARPLYAALCLLLIEAVTNVTSHTTSFNSSARHLHLFGWHLLLHENDAIQSPQYTGCKFYTGYVVNGSTAMVTECEGQWYGLLQADELVALPPQSEGSAGDHVLRRRHALLTLAVENMPVFDLRNDIVSEVDEMDVFRPRIYSRSSQATREDFYRSPSAKKRLWLELAIVVDHTMFKFYGGKNKVQRYVLAIMNIVSAIFNDRSLGVHMTLVINHLFVDSDHRHKYVSPDLKKTHESVLKWNKKHINREKDSKWDALIWLTRAELNGQSGFATLNRICNDTNRAVAVVRDEGYTTAFVAAHELGHLLGLDHDDECEKKTKKTTIMAPVVGVSMDYTWSHCSKESLEKSRTLSCLHKPKNTKGLVLDHVLKPDEDLTFTMDEQCRSAFGNGYTACTIPLDSSVCALLYCSQRSSPNECVSKHMAPLEGTPCKDGHWCVQRSCVPKTGRMNETSATLTQANEGSPNQDSAKCDAVCGYGLRYSQESCNTEKVGACDRGAPITCWSGQSCNSTTDIRRDQCRRRNSQFIPYVHESKLCELWCVNETGGEASRFGWLPDGTPCSYERPFDICYKGSCIVGQCNESDPTCNGCSTGHCKTYSKHGTLHLWKGWNPIVTIPSDARKFTVNIETPLPLQIAVRVPDKQETIFLKKHSRPAKVNQNKHNDYYKYDTDVPQNLQIVAFEKIMDFEENNSNKLQGKAVVAGMLLKWTDAGSYIILSADSQPTSSIQIQAAAAVEVQSQLDIVVNYTFHFSTLSQKYFIAPKESRQKFVWAAGEWEECSRLCGDEGIQERQVYCVPASLRTRTQVKLIYHSVSPARCHGPRLALSQACNRLPCPVYWKELPWTPCTTSCGRRGVQRRPLYCPAADETLCGVKPPERQRQCRGIPRCPLRPSNLSVKDVLSACQYYQIEELRRYCPVSYFRKKCSKSCRDVDDGEIRG